MHGHPWSRILNPQKENKKETKVKSFFEKLKNQILRKSDEECPEVYLRQFWESIDFVKIEVKNDINFIV
jgi:phosphoribosyl-ATP pyrophosphohydrolase